ncbi:MAG: 30S ribosomal protein S15 [Chloroflexi bacterium]|nr:30S ribosomal protein S15 [Chloroflexota bacterium]
MAIEGEQKRQIIAEYRAHDTDVGSAGVQVAVLTARINSMVEHMRVHKHDYSSERGLLKMVGRRRRLLRYINRQHPQHYRELIARLGLRG